MYCAVRRLGLLNSEYYLSWMPILTMPILTVVLQQHLLLHEVGVQYCLEVNADLAHISSTAEQEHISVMSASQSLP